MISRRTWICVAAMFVVATSTDGLAQRRGGAPSAPLDIAGKWTGTWSAFNPAQPSTPPKEQCAHLDANVAAKDAAWIATFEGDCGRPYKYTITMDGRQTGPAVLFKGSADLGAQDGGVYDWIGRATNTEFIGFYTNAYSTGTFSLTRAK